MVAIDWDAAIRWGSVLFLVFICLGVYLGTLYFTLKFKTQTKSKKVDPLFRGLIFSFAIIVIIGTLEVTGLIEAGSTKKYFPIYFIVFIATVLIYWFVSRPHMPLPVEKQIKFMLKYVSDYYNARTHNTQAYMPYMIVFKESYDSFSDAVTGNAVFELFGEDFVAHKYLVKISAYDGRLIMLTENPPLIEIHRLTGERVASKNETNPYKMFNDYENESTKESDEKQQKE